MKWSVVVVLAGISACFAGGWISGTCIPEDYPEATSYKIDTIDDHDVVVDTQIEHVGDTYCTAELSTGYYVQWCTIYRNGNFLSMLGKINLHVTEGDTLTSNYYKGFYLDSPEPLSLFTVTWGRLKALI